MAIELVSIAIGIGAGGVVGAVVGAAMSKGKGAELENKLAKLEGERDKVRKQLKSGEEQLDKAKKRAEELAEALDETKKNLRDMESAKKKHLEEAKRFEEAAKDLEGKAKAAEKQAKHLEKSAKEAEKAAHEKSELASKLQEDLKKAGKPKTADYKGVENDMNGILKVLCEHEKQEAAVIADANGIVVAAYGDGGVKEGMAAAANRITKIGEQLKGMVDFNEVSTFRISDTTNHVIAGRTFDVAGEMLALATVGAQMPSDGSLDGAMKHLHTMLG
jgi:chromosome segregation ATPase